MIILFSTLFYKKSVKRISSITPGIPSIPTSNAVIIFNPMWKLNIWPIKLIINIRIPPNIELPIIFIIPFNGTAKILPIINKKNIQAK